MIVQTIRMKVPFLVFNCLGELEKGQSSDRLARKLLALLTKGGIKFEGSMFALPSLHIYRRFVGFVIHCYLGFSQVSSSGIRASFL
jgi:hypothetical protein